MAKRETAQLLKGKPNLPKGNGAILLIQLGDIGDAVLTLPAIATLKRRFPMGSLVVCVREHARELMEDCPHVDHVLAVDKRKRKPALAVAHQVRFLRRLRKHRCSVAIELRTGTRGAILARLSGARARIGRYANDGTLWRNRLFTHLIKPVCENRQYAARHNLNITAPFGLLEEDPRPEIAVGEKRLASVEKIFEELQVPKNRPLVAVHPFSLWKYKEWQLLEMSRLLDKIQAEYHCAVIVTGAPGERKRAEDLVGLCVQKPYNLAGKTSIGELPAVFQNCRLFIGVDTAALHIAAAVGIPTIGIFGPSSWTNWAPRGESHLVIKKGLKCQPCSRKGCDDSERSRCLSELTHGEIYDESKRLLDEMFHKKGEKIDGD